MEIARRLLSALIEALLRPFEGRDPLLSLIPLGILVGVSLLWVFARLSNQEAIRDAKRRLHAHLYELRLFVDEPRIIFRAQVGLLRQNVRYLGLMLIPAAAATIPLTLLFLHLEAFYGRSPLYPGRSALVTVQLQGSMQASDPAPALELPGGLVLETPPVRVLAESQVSWRVRPLRPLSGVLRVISGGESATKTIEAGAGPAYLAARRVSSALDALLNPGEPKLEGRLIGFIEVDYPSADVELFGISMHWMWWMLIVSMATALLLRRRFRVVF